MIKPVVMAMSISMAVNLVAELRNIRLVGLYGYIVYKTP